MGYKFLHGGQILLPSSPKHQRRKTKIETYKITQPGDKLVVDSVVLNPMDKFEIGTSHNCETVDTTFIWFDAIEIFDAGNKSRVVKKKDFPDYLQKMKKIDCSTYSVQ